MDILTNDACPLMFVMVLIILSLEECGIYSVRKMWDIFFCRATIIICLSKCGLFSVVQGRNYLFFFHSLKDSATEQYFPAVEKVIRLTFIIKD